MYAHVGGVGSGAVSDEVALDYLCDQAETIDRNKLAQAVRTEGLCDPEAIELLEAFHIAELVDNQAVRFPGRLSLPGLAGRKEVSLREALCFVAQPIYEHRELLLKLLADCWLHYRLDFAEALVIAEAVMVRNGFEIERTEEGISVLANRVRRMRADLLLGRRSAELSQAALEERREH